MTRLVASLSDKLLARELLNAEFTEVKDTKLPLVARFNSKRTFITFYVVTGGEWLKLGRSNELNCAAAKKLVPEIIARKRHGESLGGSGVFSTVGELIEWYQQRVASNKNLSESRVTNVNSVVKVHLMPTLSDVTLADLNADIVDKKLIWPLQQHASISMVKYVFQVLKVAFNEAQHLNMIIVNPLQTIKFTDFISTPIQPKAGALHPHLIEPLLVDLQDESPVLKMLIMMMLLFGTRIGETRKAKWRDFNLAEGDDACWIIPAINAKNRKQHIIPISKHARALILSYKAKQKQCGERSTYVFPSIVGDTFIGGSHASKIIRHFSQGDFTAHDIRKVARTVWGQLGVDGLIGELLLNHTLGKTVNTYFNEKHLWEQKRKALVNYHEWLIKQFEHCFTL